MDKRPKKNVRATGQAEAVVIQRYYRMYQARRAFLLRLKMFKKKSNIARELLETEQLYVDNLDILNTKFLQPIQNGNEKVIGCDLLSRINLLTGILKIIIKYHLIILGQLRLQLQDWRPATTLGDIFLKMSSYLKTYTQYVTHYQPIVQMLKTRKDAAFTNYLNSLVTSECKGKGLKDYLIMPVQRIPRYNMMLADLVRSTWEDHRDYENLSDAGEKVHSVCEHVEFMSDQAFKLEKKMELVKKIKFPKKGMEPITLAAPHRKYIWEDDIALDLLSVVLDGSISYLECKLIVFSDILLFCVEKKADKWNVIHYVSNDQVIDHKLEGDCYEIHTMNGIVKIKKTAKSNAGIFQLFDAYFHNEEIANEESNVSSRRTVRIRQIATSAGASDSSDPDEKKLSKTLSLKNIKRSLSSPKLSKKNNSPSQIRNTFRKGSSHELGSPSKLNPPHYPEHRNSEPEVIPPPFPQEEPAPKKDGSVGFLWALGSQ